MGRTEQSGSRTACENSKDATPAQTDVGTAALDTSTSNPSHVLRIAGLGGSLRPESSSLAALKVPLEGASAAGATTDLLDLRSLDLPMYDPSSGRVPES